MSDQSPSLGNTTYVGAGGGGIVSINTDTDPAQSLVGGSGITIVDTPGVHTIHNAGVLSFGRLVPRNGNIVVTPSATVSIVEGPNGTFTFSVPSGVFVTGVGTNAPRTGNVTLVAGSGMSINESPTGTFTFASTGTSGVASFGLSGSPRTGAIVIAGSANITVTESPTGTFTIATAGSAGIVSINADTGAAQTITGTLPITITNPGSGSHVVGVNPFTSGTSGIVPSPSGFSGFAALSPTGWRERQLDILTDEPPGNGQTLFANTDNTVLSDTITAVGYALVVGRVSCTNPTVSSDGTFVGATIKQAGIAKATNTFHINTQSPMYMEVSTILHVVPGQVIELVLYNGAGQNLVTKGSYLSVCTIFN